LKALREAEKEGGIEEDYGDFDGDFDEKFEGKIRCRL